MPTPTKLIYHCKNNYTRAYNLSKIKIIKSRYHKRVSTHNHVSARGKTTTDYKLIYSLWPSDVIWLQSSWSTLVQVMACCLATPSHYLNQCWLYITEVLWQSSESNVKASTQAAILMNEFEKCTSKIIVIYSMSQWVKQWGTVASIQNRMEISP